MEHKKDLTCTYCLKILSKPVTLLCGDTICQQHLTEMDVLKANAIKCKTCKREFNLKENEFTINKVIKNLLDNMSHLSDNQKNQVYKQV